MAIKDECVAGEMALAAESVYCIGREARFSAYIRQLTTDWESSSMGSDALQSTRASCIYVHVCRVVKLMQTYHTYI